MGKNIALQELGMKSATQPNSTMTEPYTLNDRHEQPHLALQARI